MATLALQPGNLIFVTGVNGLIGSHITDQFLARGYNVRGAVRDSKRAGWLTEYFSQRHPSARFELVSVPDMTVDGCYDEVIKGCDGFVHVASPLLGQTYDQVQVAIDGGLNALKASAKEPKIKRFVFTSSSCAAIIPKTDVDYAIDENSWNDEAVEQAKNLTDDVGPEVGGFLIYMATKTETERALWKWMKENKPGFVLNTVLPNANYGKTLRPDKQGWPSTVEWARIIFVGHETASDFMNRIPPQYYIDVVDDALLHVAALIYNDVTSERLFGFAGDFNWNDLLAVFRKECPERKFHDDLNLGRDRLKVPSERAEELLKRLNGGKGWTSLEESVKIMVADFVDAEKN